MISPIGNTNPSPVFVQDRMQSIRNRQKTTITPGQREYLMRQISVMAANGAKESDVLEFLRDEGINVPSAVSPERMQRVSSGAPTVPNSPGTETPGFLRGLSMRALQGLTFGFGDEAMGAPVSYTHLTLPTN